jgi:hypothetical protein
MTLMKRETCELLVLLLTCDAYWAHSPHIERDLKQKEGLNAVRERSCDQHTSHNSIDCVLAVQQRPRQAWHSCCAQHGSSAADVRITHKLFQLSLPIEASVIWY